MKTVDRKLKQIRDKTIDCRKCPLYRTRTLPVVGQGNHAAKIIFVGEAPGQNEDKTGRPFCGQAGGVLDELLASIGQPRESVYIGNILKCRPPQNRNPLENEIEACAPYLEEQIEAIRPKIIAALGNYAAVFILKKYGLEDKIEGISKIHGKVFEAAAPFGGIKIIPLYHPAVAVYNANMKETLKKDFLIIKNFLNNEK
ncbi:MAG: uracil-DNA glycosylase [Candidatus Portnoybacteria bacterium CG_4_8_14_3_um_filter_44_15]|uniref:Type-4 uracil-DNA glycosylase n=4 Tax=Candidatus Portnoyibacteriota TaxID=1817913 RepID=A0A2M7YL90_9BACT|nr:MAG: uracil-DNA glycosylase [Parcubacteria group bacterium CG1_02_44_65]PIP16094.1 MAG: uracil-DNA glycosylase [Candidatus Portnoybacteria bacterium CG23_combo_of_CG06-09_8_20_14_all_44_36]PIW74579.1 MAG: uracil-DNA glycosylase [Candidatus Portnoybacteria bacterium CG_4_8_14_3_um_filter_44_15]PIZ69839.1 MAG: uracil-DNA glycosylase [Candidatus Portnoybacteria bacterium CG_4_10_14_0_2_um_filter_43_36]PJA63682.1 MAG: uracil-DNA glycosylase [Candidatus Portnoybacteria bacterium CG_4_9_14_3_um_fi